MGGVPARRLVVPRRWSTLRSTRSAAVGRDHGHRIPQRRKSPSILDPRYDPPVAERLTDAPVPSTRLCTIAAGNYLSRVRVLAESVRRHGPGEDLIVFLIDDPEGTTDTSGEPFTVLPLTSVPIDPVWFAQMTLYYDLTELATAIKPWVLEAVATTAVPTADGPRPPDAVAYLDPDTELLAPLDDLWAAAAAGELVLTPHSPDPFPRDGLGLTERTLLQSGVFNLGFVALPTGGCGPAVLSWWQERLRFDALIAHADGLFTDQRWMDLAPTLFPCHIVTDRGVNVAYWNLHERPLSRRDGVLMAGDTPVRLFHFSGYDPTQPHILSRYQGHQPRVMLSEQPELVALYDDYRARIASSRDGDAEPAPYRWAQLPNGITLTTWMRRRYRSELQAFVEAHPGAPDAPPDPMGPTWLGDLMDWWCAPVAPRALPRMVEALRMQRYDLEIILSWPVPAEAAQGAAKWLTTTGVAEEGLTPTVALRLADAVAQWAAATTAATERRPPPDERVVNLVGFAGSASGLASAMAGLADLCDAAELEHRVIGVTHPFTTRRSPEERDDLLDYFAPGPPPPPADIAVVGILANTLADGGPIGWRRFFGDSYRVGYWWWEVDRMGEDYRQHLALVDEIWVGSAHVAHLFRHLTDVPVHRVPLPPRQPEPGPVDLPGLGIDPETTLFTFAFDFGSTVGRKNPLGLVEAWRTAFTPADGCTLAIKSLNSSLHRVNAEALRHAVAGRPDIVLIEDVLDTPTLDGLLAASAAYVSLHRAEGLGLGMLDATLLGVPVIATASGGCLDFLAPDSSWLVPGSPVPVGPGNEPYPPDATWCEPDLDVAVRHLRAIAADPHGARTTAAVARTRALDTYDASMCVAILHQRINDIRNRLAAGWVPAAGSGGGR